jgi:hypothetical protein
MNVNFWGKMSEEYLKENPELPPLSDKTLAAFEKRIGLKLPKALTDLLRIKNGGPLQNTDFKFKDKEYEVTYIKSVTPDETFDSVRSYAFVLDDSHMSEMRKQLQKNVGDLSKLFYVAEPNGHPYAFALNYNHLNSIGEPTVYCVWMDCDEVDAKRIADSFAEFLAGQYFGDEHPTVDLEEARKYQLVAQGGYEGRYKGKPEKGLLSGLAVQVRWKICSDKSRLIVFQDIDWGGQLEITREEIHKSALVFDFPSLESYGVELEPDLAKMIRPAIEIEVLSKYEAPLIPDCYELLLHIQPGGKKWVSTDSSSPYQGRWKNRKSKVVYSSVKSSSKVELKRTLQAVAESVLGMR